MINGYKENNLNGLGLISVIIPAFNIERYIKRCVDSVLANTYQNLEVICIDDGSTDCTGKILDEYNEMRIKVIHKNNGGLSRARNTGLSFATGEYISFIDGDDYVNQYYFERLIEAIKGCGVSHCSFEQIDISSDKRLTVTGFIGTTSRDIMAFSDALGNYEVKSHVWGKLYRKYVVDGIRFSERLTMSEDKLFNAQVFIRQNGEKIGVIQDKLYYYCIRPDSITHLKGNDIYPLGEEFLRLALRSNNAYFVEEAYKSFLSHRYLNMFKENAKDMNKKCNIRLHDCHKVALDSKMELRVQLLYKLMSTFPILYRLYRITTDRTMIEWEKQEKKKCEVNNGSKRN